MANIFPSKETHEFLENTLAKRTGIRRNLWTRIAVARSITLPNLPEQADFDSGGLELARNTILGEQDTLFRAMFIQRYQRALSDDEFFPKLFKLHLERGVRNVLRLDVGNIVDTNEPFAWMLNKANNAHSAVVGTTGSGKTHFVKDLLIQITEQTQGNLPFIFFDYARGDVAGDANFVRATKA